MCSLVRSDSDMPILGLIYVYFIYRASPLQAKKVKLVCLKGLAHEIDIKNFDKSFQNSLRKGRGCFLKSFWGSE